MCPTKDGRNFRKLASAQMVLHSILPKAFSAPTCVTASDRQALLQYICQVRMADTSPRLPLRTTSLWRALVSTPVTARALPSRPAEPESLGICLRLSRHFRLLIPVCCSRASPVSDCKDQTRQCAAGNPRSAGRSPDGLGALQELSGYLAVCPPAAWSQRTQRTQRRRKPTRRSLRHNSSKKQRCPSGMRFIAHASMLHKVFCAPAHYCLVGHSVLENSLSNDAA